MTKKTKQQDSQTSFKENRKMSEHYMLLYNGGRAIQLPNAIPSHPNKDTQHNNDKKYNQATQEIRYDVIYMIIKHTQGIVNRLNFDCDSNRVRYMTSFGCLNDTLTEQYFWET